MKATFALLFDHQVYNLVRRLAMEVHQKYRVGLAGSQLPPHVSLKQPFSVPDLDSVEAYFDQLAGSIGLIAITFPRIGGPSDAPVLWLDVEEDHTLRHLHTRINQELAERFANTRAPFDGLAYHFHMTIALALPPPPGVPSISLYQTITRDLASRDIAFQATAQHLALFYYDDDEFSPGSFITYKVLPLGMSSR